MPEQIDTETRLLAMLELGASAAPDAEGNLPADVQKAILSLAEPQTPRQAAMSLEAMPRHYKIKARTRRKSKIKRRRC
jgi:hypothetical protein